MLYKTIFLAVGLLATAQLSAQNFSLGIKGGYSLNDLGFRGDSSARFAEGTNRLSGFQAGLESRWQLRKRVALLMELQYARKGYSYPAYEPANLAETQIRLNYVRLPIIGSVEVFKRLSVQVGVEAGWLFSDQVRSEGKTLHPIIDLHDDFDLSLLGALEYQFGKNFFLTIRQSLGLIPLFDLELTDNDGQDNGTGHAYNNSTQFSAGYRYYFGK